MFIYAPWFLLYFGHRQLLVKPAMFFSVDSFRCSLEKPVDTNLGRCVVFSFVVICVVSSSIGAHYLVMF